MKTFCISHYWNITANIGDISAAFGTLKALTHNISPSIHLHSARASRGVKARQGHLVLIGGGGLIRSKRNKGGLLYSVPWQNMRCPVICFGLGYSAFYGEKCAFDHQGRRQLVDDLYRAAHFSFRDDGTKETLVEMGIAAAKDVKVIPDPSMLSPVSPMPLEKKPGILLQIAGERKISRYGYDNPDLRWLDVLRKIDTCTVIAHTRWDLELCELVARRVGAKVIRFDKHKPEDFYRLYSRSRIVLATRGHGVWLAAAACTPFVVLDTVPKASTTAANILGSSVIVHRGGRIEETARDIISREEEYQQRLFLYRETAIQFLYQTMREALEAAGYASITV